MGDIFGVPSAIETLLAFFLESTFLGIWVFGWERLSKRTHAAATWLVPIGSHLSALWILIANCFMQQPVGFVLREGRPEMTSFLAPFTNPHIWFQFRHVLASALEAAQLGSWLRSLPQGIDTWLGEQGHKVSAGERQRIAIARAYLRPSCMLLLDEPIAHLDPLTAQQVILALEPLMAARTTLLVTHRLLGLEDFPEILVLSGGRVLERGAHVELLAEQGWYARMWRLQREVSLWDHGLDDLPPSGSQTSSGIGAA